MGKDVSHVGIMNIEDNALITLIHNFHIFPAVATWRPPCCRAIISDFGKTQKKKNAKTKAKYIKIKIFLPHSFVAFASFIYYYEKYKILFFK